MSKKIHRFIEQYLAIKIGVEIKCCLMFFMVLCFYGGYRLLRGIHDANIFRMLEMVILAYLLGWIQALIGSDFDAVDRLRLKDWMVVIGSSAIYTLFSILFCWFGDHLVVTLTFAIYMVAVYLCIFLIYKIKRVIDAKLLNDDLKQFKQRNNKEWKE